MDAVANDNAPKKATPVASRWWVILLLGVGGTLLGGILLDGWRTRRARWRALAAIEDEDLL